MKLPRIGITCGDVNGIGLEVILKALSNPVILNQFIPILYCSQKVFNYHKSKVLKVEVPYQIINQNAAFQKNKLNIVPLKDYDEMVNFGEINAFGGRCAYDSLEKAVNDFKEDKIDALLTAPIHKKSMALAGFDFPGHTEYLSHQFNNAKELMILVEDKLKVGLITGHISLKDVASALNPQMIIKKAKIFFQSLKVDFNIDRPKIAILGLNPHAGDSGLFGKEEESIIAPAIMSLKKESFLAMGPYAADGFFGAGNFAKFDGILAMYHDQGLAPFKALSFGNGVNFTAGLPLIRTSPDHGTGFDIAGQGKANEQSLRQAIFLAIDLLKNRNDHNKLIANRLKHIELDEDPENQKNEEND